jgi:hypothetical protein
MCNPNTLRFGAGFLFVGADLFERDPFLTLR